MANIRAHRGRRRVAKWHKGRSRFAGNKGCCTKPLARQGRAGGFRRVVWR
jgi:hypothetical protein